MSSLSNWHQSLCAAWQVRGRQRALFFRSLGTLFECGVRIDSALHCLSCQGESEELQRAALGLSQGIQTGQRLSHSMSRYPWIFSRLQCKMLAVGEQSGRLADVLMRLARHEEAGVASQLKLRSVLVTPIIISALCILLIVVVPPLLFEGMLQMLADTASQLPWPTLMLLCVSRWLRSPLFYLAMAGLATAGGLATRAFLSSRSRAAALQGLVLKLPVLGPVLQMITVTRFGQNLQAMLESGMPLMGALELSAQACNSPLLEARMPAVLEALQNGETLMKGLRRLQMLPPGFLYGVDVAEESGKLAQMLKSLNDLYALELEQRMSVVSALLEPLVLSFVGLVVGFTVIATLLPVLKVVDSF
jgi:type IV pilus assembly protein PilC